MADPRGPFRPDVRLDRSQVTDRRGVSAMRIGGRTLRRRGTTVGGTLMPVPYPVSIKSTPVGSPVRRGIRNDHTPAGRRRIQKVKSVRMRERLTPLKPIRSIGKRPVVRGAPLVPPVGGLLRGAISIGRSVLSGSPITGPTKVARMSAAAAGPIAGVRVNRPSATPRKRTRGGSARLT